jgi:hypothetical protein
MRRLNQLFSAQIYSFMNKKTASRVERVKELGGIKQTFIVIPII